MTDTERARIDKELAEESRAWFRKRDNEHAARLTPDTLRALVEAVVNNSGRHSMMNEVKAHADAWEAEVRRLRERVDNLRDEGINLEDVIVGLRMRVMELETRIDEHNQRVVLAATQEEK